VATGKGLKDSAHPPVRQRRSNVSFSGRKKKRKKRLLIGILEKIIKVLDISGRRSPASEEWEEGRKFS